MISEGLTAAEITKNSRKAYVREVMNIVGEAPNYVKTEVAIGYDDSNFEGMKFPHADPLVITSIIENFPVKRVLVDNRVYVDNLFCDAFLKMGYNDI